MTRDKQTRKDAVELFLHILTSRGVVCICYGHGGIMASIDIITIAQFPLTFFYFGAHLYSKPLHMFPDSLGTHTTVHG